MNPATISQKMIPPIKPQVDDRPHRPATPAAKMSSAELWTTLLVVLAASLVYLSLFLKSLWLFVIGELACVALAPIIIWFERARVREWWNNRPK